MTPNADPSVTNTQRADAGLPVYSTTRNPVPVPTTAPMVHLEAANVQQHVFRFTNAVDAHANVRPTGVKSIQIFGAFDTAPVTDSDFELLGSTTRMNATLNFPISDAGKSIWYRFRYLNTKDQPGPCPPRGPRKTGQYSAFQPPQPVCLKEPWRGKNLSPADFPDRLTAASAERPAWHSQAICTVCAAPRLSSTPNLYVIRLHANPIYE